MEQDNTIQLLRRVTVFSDLDAGQLATVARYTRTRRFAKGEEVFGEGSAARRLYVIREGEVVVFKKAGGGKTVDLARFIAGESFGELDLFDSAPMSATAAAERDSVLLVFPDGGTNLEDAVRDHPGLFAVVLRRLLAVVAGRIRTANTLIAEKAPWIHELRAQLLTDKLTGLYNRNYLDEELPKTGSPTDEPAGVLMIKPDNFKQVNDRYGHEAGDAALRLIGGFVKSVLADAKGAAVRYRGDEFALVLHGAGAGEAAGAGERVRREIGGLDLGPITANGRLRITASVGVAQGRARPADWAVLVQRAHEAMLEARARGGDRVAVAAGGF
jgi:diguanylate cyclase (GGDEF)-like protein